MFDDDRGGLVQIGEWVNRLEEGLDNRSALSDEVFWWRLSRIEQCMQRLSRPYIARHPELSELKLPSIEQVLNEPPPSLPLAIALAEQTVATFKPLLTSLPPPPLPRPPRPRDDSRQEEVQVPTVFERLSLVGRPISFSLSLEKPFSRFDNEGRARESSVIAHRIRVVERGIDVATFCGGRAAECYD